MKLSIITVCKNAEKIIERTMQSVLRQECARDLFEYIIIDGVSTDGTLDVINRYRDDIDVLVSEPDAGIYDAMNKGISKASGDYVAFMNADDWYEPDAFSSIGKIASETKADVIYGDTNYWNLDGTMTVMKHQPPEKIWEDMVACHQSTFVRRELFETKEIGQFDICYRVAADFDFLQKAYIAGAKFVGIDKTISNYTLGGESAKFINIYFDDYTQIIENHSKFYEFPEKLISKQKRKAEGYYVERAKKKNKDVLGDALSGEIADFSDDIYLWGTGIWGGELTRLLNQRGLIVKKYIDSNIEKQGGVFQNVEIGTPTELERIEAERSVVIVAIRGIKEEVEKTIRNLRLPSSLDIVFLDDIFSAIAQRERENS